MAVTSKALDKTQALNIMYDFFKFLQKSVSQSSTPNAEELEKYLSKNFELTNNGQPMVRSAADFLTRIQKFQKKYSKLEISKPLEDPIMQDNKLAILYKYNFTPRTGGSKEIIIMSLATFEENKMRSWHIISHEKGTGDWDK
jgi:hypothetical protein